MCDFCGIEFCIRLPIVCNAGCCKTIDTGAAESRKKGWPKKSHVSKFDMQFSREPLVPGGCPSHDLEYSLVLVLQVMRWTAS